MASRIAAVSHRFRRNFAALALVLLATGLGASTLARLGPPVRALAPAVPASLERGRQRLRALSPEAARRLSPAVDRALAGRGDAGAALARLRAALAGESLRRAARETRWLSLEPRFAAAVDTAAAQAAAPGLERREAGWVERARHRLALARRLAAAGRTDEALMAGEQILALTDAVGTSHGRLFARFSEPAELRSWRAWTEAAVEESRRTQRPAILIDKLARKLYLLRRGRQLATFDIEFGSRGLERKLHQGDRATPEGRYRITEIKTGGRTRYHKALLLDYPNDDDLTRLRRAQQRGEVPRHLDAGSLIEIHGHGGQGRDWTDGCVALADHDMDRLMIHAQVGAPVTIVGTVGGRAGSESRF